MIASGAIKVDCCRVCHKNDKRLWQHATESRRNTDRPKVIRLIARRVRCHFSKKSANAVLWFADVIVSAESVPSKTSGQFVPSHEPTAQTWIERAVVGDVPVVIFPLTK